MTLTRRDMLLCISALATATVASCEDPSETVIPAAGPTPAGGSDLQILASVAYDLFPFPALAPELYIKAAEALLALNAPVVVEGLLQLRNASGTTAWMDLPEAQRIEVLTALEDSPFFTVARATTIAVLFRDQAVFDLVGYGGSAIEQGGYLNRGFEQITWLPEAQ